MAILSEKIQSNLWTNLSKEAADQLVQTLYLLIDEIQFSRYDEAEKPNETDLISEEQKSLSLEFNDEVPF